jgi:Ca2+-dependent lipid-binding protein
LPAVSISIFFLQSLDLKSLRRTSPYVVRLHVFNGAELPASDDNGMLDPYLKIGFKDCPPTKSKKHHETKDPLFLQT